ncbi:hypothetical protein EK21DRAFT_53265 [Setomelanomma holmii]|uniref:DUF6594 domain-containing protein n=1 Tax=Setomelanomma holmii TaxID=210430 RepID=A0A9P4LSW6_9PLEO|nr:hypothetical protein EK21DRAFT_53265 [Setomelanomma holmii]
MSSTPAAPQGYSSFLKHIAVLPETGIFHRFGDLWAKRVYDDASNLVTCLAKVTDEVRQRPELGAETLLDCPMRVIKAKCPKKSHKPLYIAWAEYDKALKRYGETLCMSAEIMNLPTQNIFNTKQVESWKLPGFKPLFDNDEFVLTGEDKFWYQGNPDQNDSCAWRAIPRGDVLTQTFVKSSPWIEKHIVDRWRSLLRRKKPDDDKQLVRWRYSRIVGALDTLSCFLASVLLTITIIVLAVVKPLVIRIAVVGIFGTLFALVLKLMAGDPSRGEVFGATAAFYAVAVVFVGSTNNDCACH